MSLTEEAYLERKWRPFPALRKLLEDKKVPDHYFGPSSASDNMFDEMGRLMEIAILTAEYESIIRKTIESMDREDRIKIYEDLSNLEKGLGWASRLFQERIDKVRKLYML